MLNKKIGVSLALLIAVTFFAAINAREKNAQREAVLMRSLLSSLSTFHIKPLNIDDQFSEKLYTLYLNRIHGSKSWLTQEDLDVLETYKWQLDDEANEGSFAFLDQVIKLERKALRKTKKYYLELLSKPFDFTRNEDYDTDQKKRPYAKNDEALKEYWRQDLKWETLTRLSEKITIKENNEEGYRGRSTAQLEEEARNEVLHRYNDLFSGYEAYTRTETLSEYLRALTNVFDPHSDYLEPAEKPADDAAQIKRLEGIGVSLTTQGGSIVADEIIFGGPAWKQGILQVNDRIEKVAQGDRGKWTDVTGMSDNEVVQLIQGKPGSKVRLVIRKPDGSSHEIALMRDVVIVEEDLAKSCFLKRETRN
ncbi:MAG: PDZ domain-containing protein [Lewinellaceae bacterium]|nr:PDZ domain-containing protein [Lewinellaceae bacterium]